MNRPVAAPVALIAGIVAQDQHRDVHQGAGLADPAEPLGRKSLALEHHQVSSQEQVAADNQIQPALLFAELITLNPQMCRTSVHAIMQIQYAIIQPTDVIDADGLA